MANSNKLFTGPDGVSRLIELTDDEQTTLDTERKSWADGTNARRWEAFRVFWVERFVLWQISLPRLWSTPNCSKHRPKRPENTLYRGPSRDLSGRLHTVTGARVRSDLR